MRKHESRQSRRSRRERSSLPVAASLFGAAASFGLCALVLNSEPQSQATAQGDAVCDSLSVTLLDGEKNIFQVVPQVHAEGEAKVIGMTYIFDEGQRSVFVPNTNAVQHDYPDELNGQTREIIAIVDYGLNNKAYGAVAMCNVSVTL